MSTEAIIALCALIVTVVGLLIGGGIFVGGYRQMIENQRLATRRAFQIIKRLNNRLRNVEAALYSEKILRQPTETGEDVDEDEP